MVKRAKLAKTAKNTRTKTKVKKVATSGRAKFPRLRTITKRGGD